MAPDSRPARRSRAAVVATILAVMAASAAVLAFGTRWAAGALRDAVPDISLTQNEVRDRVYAAIQREARASFLVTGRLDVMAETRVDDTKTFLPGLLDVSMGTTSARVRVPGRISYGVDLKRLRASDIVLHEDGTLEVSLPPMEVHAVEPALSRMEVETDVGWARLQSRSGRAAEHRAIGLIGDVLRSQGAAHLADAEQPRIHTARTVAALLRPVMQAAGHGPAGVVVRVGTRTYRLDAPPA